MSKAQTQDMLTVPIRRLRVGAQFIVLGLPGRLDHLGPSGARVTLAENQAQQNQIGRNVTISSETHVQAHAEALDQPPGRTPDGFERVGITLAKMHDMEPQVDPQDVDRLKQSIRRMFNLKPNKTRRMP